MKYCSCGTVDTEILNFEIAEIVSLLCGRDQKQQAISNVYWSLSKLARSSCLTRESSSRINGYHI